jgi:peptidyl-prolyl cis-trans isomerase D
MLDVLRAGKSGFFSWLILLAIIASFVIFFGPGKFSRGEAGCGGTPSYAARVDGDVIPRVAFQMQMEQQAEYARQQLGDKYLDALPYLGRQIMSQLVSQAVLASEAQRRGIAVSDQDLSRSQWAVPDFKGEDGRFDKAVYQRAINRRWGSVASYEAMARASLAVDRLRAALANSIHVPESDVHEVWKMYSDQLDLSYVLVPEADARAEVTVTDAEVAAFAGKEGARIEKFYKDNAARYDQPNKVRARHILARVEGGNDDAAKKKIEDAIARLQKGEDFAKVAAEVSDDANTKNAGGELGVIAAGAVDDQFAQAALALGAGKLSAPVRTPAGWHVIRVDEVIPGKKVPLDVARLEIARELLIGDRAAALARQKAEGVLAAARTGKPLTELYPTPRPALAASGDRPAAPEVKATLTLGGKPVAAQETGPMPASSPEIYGLPGAGDLLKDALAAEAGTVLPRIYDTQAGKVVAVVRQRKRPDEKLYPEQRHAMELMIRGDKARQLEQTWMSQLAARSKVEINEAILPGAPRQRAPLPEQD